MLKSIAQLLSELNQQDKAEEIYRKLLEGNPDKLSYYKLLLKCKGLDLGEYILVQPERGQERPKLTVLLSISIRRYQT